MSISTYSSQFPPKLPIKFFLQGTNEDFCASRRAFKISNLGSDTPDGALMCRTIQELPPALAFLDFQTQFFSNTDNFTFFFI